MDILCKKFFKKRHKLITKLLLISLAFFVLVIIIHDPTGKHNLSAQELIKNGDFSLWDEEIKTPYFWILGGEGKGIVDDEIDIGEGDETGIKITMHSGNFIALYQDIENLDKYKNKEYIFSAHITSNYSDSVYLAIYDGFNWRTSAPHSGSANWEVLTVKGKISENISKFRVHIWIDNKATAYVDSVSFKVGPSNELSKFNPKIEFLQWPEWGNRNVYRSKYNNIALTFGHRGVFEEYFYNNFFTYDMTYDYFCIPDDFVLAYNENVSFRVKALALNWTVKHELINQGELAIIEHLYEEERGLHSYALRGSKEHGSPSFSKWRNPPLTIRVIHEMFYNESYVPMKIFINNTYDEPLRVIYVFQDGALMTSSPEEGQERVHQYWDDGGWNYARLWNITKENRMNKNNWVGMYNDNHGGMFAATYAPPESKGIRFHATWDRGSYIGQNPHVNSIENILLGVNTPDAQDLYDSNFKIHGTLIDFGVIQPGEERVQIIIKIMFTGYEDRKEMHEKVIDIIERIPTYKIPSYDLDEYDDR